MTSYPDFICVGAQRAGTTWLHQCLKEHPDIYVPDRKELQFFNANFERGWEWYENFFRPAATGAVKGEVTPNYLGDDVAMGRLYDALPEVKIIIILRSPVARTLSAYELFKASRFPDLDVLQACSGHPYIVQQSLYADALKSVLSRFPKEKVLITFYEDLEHSPSDFIRNVYRFIGVDSDFYPSSNSKRFNKVIYPNLQDMLLRWNLGFLIGYVKNSFLGDIIRRRSVQQGIAVDEKLQSKLYLNFSDDIAEVEKLLGVDLSHWKYSAY